MQKNELPRAGVSLALADEEIAAALDVLKDIESGDESAAHLVNTELRYRNHTIVLRMPAVGMTIRLHTVDAEPWLDRLVTPDAIRRGSITVEDAATLARYVKLMEAPQAPAASPDMTALSEPRCEEITQSNTLNLPLPAEAPAAPLRARPNF